MGRLRNLSAKVGIASRRLTCAQDHGPTPVSGNPLRRLYDTARWRRLREDILLRDLYTCRMCGKLHRSTRTLTCDHVRPHRGDLRLFWDPNNLQALCTDPCHVKHKQALEQESLQHRGVWD